MMKKTMHSLWLLLLLAVGLTVCTACSSSDDTTTEQKGGDDQSDKGLSDTPVMKALSKGGDHEKLGATFAKLIVEPNYNQAVNDHVLPLPDATASDYVTRKQQFIDGYKAALPDEKAWASRCQDCEVCLSKCPQQIRIPNQMARIVETLRKR